MAKAARAEAAPQNEDVAVAGGERIRPFTNHVDRAAAIGEVHARPSRPVTVPRSFLAFAFEVAPGDPARADRAAFQELCRAQGAVGPGAEARHHVVPFGNGTLKWERHAEFTTYTWDAPLRTDEEPFRENPRHHPFGEGFVQTGPLLVAIRLDVMPHPKGPDARAAMLRGFDPSSLCVAEVEGGRGLVATDFRPDGDGRTRVLVLDQGLSPAETGVLVQRLLEIETYRTLAILGLPDAQRVAPEIQRIERDLERLTQTLRETHDIATSRKLLDELSALTSALEADAASTSYRFAASRAYHLIVVDRLAALGERPVERYSGFSEFLGRRLGPALRTIQTMEDRQASLSRKLARATQLLRTRVDVELEHQSRDLLHSMERAASTQLRLQETVEGLSVAAISYYVVGLLHHVAEAAREAHLVSVDPAVASGVSVPIVIGIVFLVVRGVRRAIAAPPKERHHDGQTHGPPEAR